MVKISVARIKRMIYNWDMENTVTLAEIKTAVELAKWNAGSAVNIIRAGKDASIFRLEIMALLESLIPEGPHTTEKLIARLAPHIGLTAAQSASNAYWQSKDNCCFGAPTLTSLNNAWGIMLERKRQFDAERSSPISPAEFAAMFQGAAWTLNQK